MSTFCRSELEHVLHVNTCERNVVFSFPPDIKRVFGPFYHKKRPTNNNQSTWFLVPSCWKFKITKSTEKYLSSTRLVFLNHANAGSFGGSQILRALKVLPPPSMLIKHNGCHSFCKYGRLPQPVEHSSCNRKVLSPAAFDSVAESSCGAPLRQSISLV